MSASEIDHNDGNDPTAATVSKPDAATVMGPDQDIEKTVAGTDAATQETADSDPNIIDWGPDDPDHPQNWPHRKILPNFVWVALLAFVSPLSSYASNIGYIIFSVACAVSPNLNVFRFFSGVFGATPVTNGGGSVGDMIRPEKRARAMSGYFLGPLLGPVVGPIAGGMS
ncbi:MAG: hypothetical protein Q9165_008900 [Trypethelium subeluteriae]